ncbi:LuxR family transcriptional regulator [Actinoallomurus acanthiterrae]
MDVTNSEQLTRRDAPRLPAEVTSFVGRRHEVAEVKRLLSVSRLVTLTGVGGVGKTRLASRVGAMLRRAFADGVWLVELADLNNPDLLVPAVCEALRIRDHSARPALEVLIDHLRDAQALVILDNCEHLVRACAILADALLRSAPGLRILATSRQPLGVVSEQTLSVPTLPVAATDAEAVAGDAVRLFAERAEAVVPGFAVTEDNREIVERICRRLDGLPLGIELAAVRLRALSVQQLLARLDDRFRLLTSGSRVVLPRHQTLRALIDWSHGLCTEAERLVWARISVFSGGLDLEAAEQVCAGDGIAREDMLDLVGGLVDKSVLVREEHPGAVRYRLLETIRQYGRERLVASGTEDLILRRHRDYYRGLAADAWTRLFGPDQVALLTRLRVEHPNLRVALEYSFGRSGEGAVGLRMATDLLYHWTTSYYLTEGRRWFDRGLATETELDATRAHALWANAWLAIIQAEPGPALSMLEESKRIGETLRLDSVGAYVALFCGMVAMYERDPDAAISYFKTAVTQHRKTGDLVGQALGLIRLSLAYSFRGDSEPAIKYAEESLALCDAHGERWHRAYTMMALGVDVWRQGDLDRAVALEEESLRFNRELDDLLGVGVNIEVLAWVAASEGRYPRAARLLGVLRVIWRRVDAPLSGYGHLARYHDECETCTRTAMGDRAFAAARDEGAALSFDEALAFALGERQPSVADSDRSPLTRRETEISRLVAEGMSNKEIAAKLVIAQRTAEGHVEHILSKLGFTSRSQIAAWVAEHKRTGGKGRPDG